ncbi:alpha/beta fold hydrolase [Nocardia sp. CDC153]|uniref:alpha/beta fold hydrolase n=1 Tax=Nocardia sp. CDC153 TaxID=3112167 RepID=UPI003FA378F9
MGIRPALQSACAATYMSARADERQEPRPLLVLLHGGGYTREYFQVCGADLVDRAAGAGFDVLAVDRPGYGASPALARGPIHPQTSATRARIRCRARAIP